MRDLVQRLREGVEWDESGPFPDAASLVMDEAADRIEHLERALKLAKMALEYHTQQTRPIHATGQSIAAIDEALHSEVIEKR